VAERLRYIESVQKEGNQMEANSKIVAVGFAYDSKTRDWTKEVTYEARDRMEAICWINMNRDWFKNMRIETFERFK
jgi:hypothetical protein